MSKTHKVTVIGAGDRGRAYMTMLKKYHENDVVISAICDLQDSRNQKAMADFGITTKFSDYKKAITETKPDIVVVATPAYFHCDIASFAMDNGCNVLTEKPFDLSMEKCFKLKEKQKQTGKSLAIGLQYRNQKVNRVIKQIMDKRLIGGNVVMSIFDIRENRPKIAMHDAVYGNGGPLNDVGCHYYDLMRWYYSSNLKSVSAQWRVDAANRPNIKDAIETKAPDNGVITAEYESGDMLLMVINWSLPTCKANNFHFSSITGTEGIVLPKEMQNYPDVKIISGDKEMTISPDPADDQDCINPELGVFDHLVAEIEGQGKVQASAEEGILSLAGSMASIRSGVLGRAVTIKEILDAKPTILECMKK
ncbi:MAG: Gfo/Idh/MocA family oxidoreductase [Treponema sp.]|nr:Gfo/Idh/MocA family oxidoreductase [Treponema sp.]